MNENQHYLQSFFHIMEVDESFFLQHDLFWILYSSCRILYSSCRIL